MQANKSFKIYPRLDQEFKKKDSSDFDLARGNLYKNRPTHNMV